MTTGIVRRADSKRHHRLDANRLRTGRSIEPSRYADNNGAHSILGRKLRDQGIEPFHGLWIRRPAFDRLQGPRERARRIAHRDADTPFSKIYADDAHNTRVASRLASARRAAGGRRWLAGQTADEMRVDGKPVDPLEWLKKTP